MQDEYYMARALKLAQRGRFTTHPTRMSGASLSKMAKLSVKVTTNVRVNHMPKYTRCVWRVKKPKVRPPMSHSNPVAIMVVRHRAVTHSSPLA